LARLYGGPVRLADAQGFETGSPRTSVRRVSLLVRPPSAPPTAILKTFATDPESGRRFSSERTALQLLRSSSAGSVAASLLAFGSDPRFLVLEDLGDGASLADHLLGDDPTAAAVALHRYGRAMAQLHAGTLGRRADYIELRGPTYDLIGADDLESVLPSAAREIGEAFGRVGVLIPSETEGEVTGVVSRILEPVGLMALVQGDACPDNSIGVGQTMRLIDFEFAGMRHLGLDAASFRMSFPTCWCASRIPDDVRRAAEATYRSELSRVLPALEDDRVFFGLLADAGAARLLYMLATRLEGALDETPMRGDTAKGRTVARRRLIWWLTAFGALAEEAHSLPTLRTAALRAGQELERRWAMRYEALPRYPAFPGGTPWPQV
jgi:hypothetical protein